MRIFRKLISEIFEFQDLCWVKSRVLQTIFEDVGVIEDVHRTFLEISRLLLGKIQGVTDKI